jgi:hypothetical protein
MKQFIDTEFLEDGRTIDLISIGIVSEDGKEYYCVNEEFDHSRATEWIKQNVLKHITPYDRWRSKEVIKDEVLEFIGVDKPEFWGYYADYDWVVFCQLFGAMINLPRGWPMYCRDIKQFCDSLGNPPLPEQGKGEHHALADARWNKRVYEYLTEFNRTTK